jgi:hypothetical protein
MEITKPFNNEIVVVKNFFDQEDLKILNLSFTKIPEESWEKENEFLAFESLKNFGGKTYAIRDNRNINVLNILNHYTDLAKNIMLDYYKNFYLHYGYYNITRTFSRGMDAHSDNNGENNVLAGCIFYFNDDFVGGELVYDKLGIIYTPQAGDFVFHPGTSEYEHHVNDVTSGVRFTCGFSAYEDK